jgi:DNA-binding IclR family transcriptional regulator
MGEVKTLARGLQILERLAEVGDGQTTTELARHFEIDKGSMSRLLGTLENHRFVERDPDTRRYYLGVYLHELGRRGGQHAMLRELVQPFLEQLAATTTENAHVGVAAATYAVTIADVPSTEALRVVSEVGRRMPLHCSAVGKCLLAYSDQMPPRTLSRFTAHTLTTLVQLEGDLRATRARGYAVDNEELTPGVFGIAAPIRNREGRAVAALGVSGPSVRFTPMAMQQMGAAVVETAERISAELAYRG